MRCRIKSTYSAITYNHGTIIGNICARISIEFSWTIKPICRYTQKKRASAIGFKIISG